MSRQSKLESVDSLKISAQKTPILCKFLTLSSSIRSLTLTHRTTIPRLTGLWTKINKRSQTKSKRALRVERL